MKNMNIVTTNLFSKDNLETLKSLVKSYPNDFELGAQIRKHFRQDSFVMSLGNDKDLGSEIRKSVINFSK